MRNEALRGGSIECAEFLLRDGCPVPAACVSNVAKPGSYECMILAIEWCALVDMHWLLCALQWAAARSAWSSQHATTPGGSKRHCGSCFKFAHEHGCPWQPSYSTRKAAQLGHLECLKYLHKQGSRRSTAVTTQAARNGHLECLKYAHELGQAGVRLCSTVRPPALLKIRAQERV